MNGSRHPTSDDYKALQTKVEAMSEALIEHRMRLENGTKVFSVLNDRLDQVEHRTTPRPMSVYKVIGITLSVVALFGGSLWALSNTIRDRPTDKQIEVLIEKHDGQGHPSMRGDIRSVQLEQAKQRVLIEGVKAAQSEQSAKIDRVLQRLPERRKRR